MPERTVIINGLSKTYAMDGWRLGWTVASEEMTRAILKVRQYTTVCVNTFIQYGAVEALTADQSCVDRMVGEFRKRRTVMLEGLAKIPVSEGREPLGAFYVFPDIRAFGRSSAEVAGLPVERTPHRLRGRQRVRFRREKGTCAWPIPAPPRNAEGASSASGRLCRR
ncbi:MAG: aminotransferase class I/II-fold pyridoxal phosphate-dependent enzyme [Candidatus Moduliflexus flocculans]|nr:aminotransferase class I/II-fold pyridoxal phosphate-dependent enzyme [Candidatus Moduliflexus flocculans]